MMSDLMLKCGQQMNNERIKLSLPKLGGTEISFIQQAFDTNWITIGGPNVNDFERKLESYLGNNSFVAALNSGTSGIHLGLILLGVQSGDEVICQSLTFSASANPIRYQGATPIFVDSEPETWNICPLALEEAIISRMSKGKKPKVIIAVHLYGVPYKVDEVRKIADKYGILILEDCAEALGSTYKNQKCGTFGDIAVLSFNGNKIITTSGGGAVVTRTKALKDKAVFLSTQAREPVSYYQHQEIGYNYRMSNVCAGIGCGQMLVLEERVKMRRAMHQFYRDLFYSISGVDLFIAPDSNYYANYWLTTILVHPKELNEKSCEDLRLYLDSQNIESRRIWKPMHLQPIFNDYPYYGTNVAEVLFEKGLCMPSGSNLNEVECKRIKESVKLFFNSYNSKIREQ